MAGVQPAASSAASTTLRTLVPRAVSTSGTAATSAVVAALARERMILRAHGDEPVGARIQHLQRRIEGVTTRQSEIGFLVAHERGDEARDAVADLEARKRHLAPERLDQLGQHAGREGRQAREPHRAARAFAERTRVAQHALHVVERALQQRQQLAPGLRECDAAAVAVKQARATTLSSRRICTVSAGCDSSARPHG